jgi:hypothetical protein
MRIFAIQSVVALLSLVPARAQKDATEPGAYAVRIVTLSLPEHETVRTAMNCPPEEETALFQSLTERIGDGKTELVSDTFTRCLEAQEQEVAWIDEHPYCTKFRIDEKWRQVIPQITAFRNLGGTIHCRIDGGNEGRKSLTVSWQRSRFAGVRTWPALTTESFTPVSQPEFLSEEISATVPAIDDTWQLAGMKRERSEPGERQGPARTLLMFVRASEGGKKRSVAPASRTSRMHWCVFRLPFQEALVLSRRDPKEDAALMERLLQRADRGDLTMDFHAASCVGATETSKAITTLEYPYPTDFSPDPNSFTFQNTGPFLTMTLSPGETPDTANARVRWESCEEPFRFLQLSPHPAGISMTMPEFSRESIDCRISVSPGAVRMAGAWMLPEDTGQRMAHVCFLKLAGPSQKESVASSNHREAFVAAYSLPPNEGNRLTIQGKTAPWEDIESLVKIGTARLLTWQCVTGAAGTTGSVKRSTEAPTATKAALHTDTGLLYGTRGTFQTIGDNFEIKLPANDGDAFFGGFGANWARMMPLDAEDLLTAAKTGATLPSPFTYARLVFPLPAPAANPDTPGPFAGPVSSFPSKETTGPLLELNKHRVLSFAPCTAPSDPEHGRWHAVVLFVRK